MKKVLAVAFAIALMSLAFSANAQVPYVQVFFDDYASVESMDCPGVGLGQLSVFALNWNMWIGAIEYMISLPSAMTMTGETFEPGVLVIGNSASGISLAFPVPGNGFAPFRTQRIQIVWNCSDCSGFADQQIAVWPNPLSGLVQAVRWPDNVKFVGVGMLSTICPVTIPVEESTWGSVKSLYQ
jgi:hypothetical protein